MALEYNQTVQETLEEGDGVEIPRGFFSHWAVYVGDGDVVHKSQINVPGTVVDSSMSNVFTTSGSGTDKACVKRENLLDVAGSSKVIRNNNKDGINPPLPGEEIKERALSSVGPSSYSLWSDNCENFTSWCRSGNAVSDQADTALTWLLGLGAVAVVGGIGYALFSGREDKKKEKHSQN